jgi:hypothetical protein
LLLSLPATPLPLLLMQLAADVRSGSCNCCSSNPPLLILLPFVSRILLLLLLVL